MPCGVLQSVEKCLILEFDSEQKNRPVTSSETRSWQIVREQEIAPVHVGLLICTTVTVLYGPSYLPKTASMWNMFSACCSAILLTRASQLAHPTCQAMVL